MLHDVTKWLYEICCICVYYYTNLSIYFRNIDAETATVLMRNEDSNGDDRLSWRELLTFRYKFTDQDLTRIRRESLQKKDIEMLRLLQVKSFAD